MGLLGSLFSAAADIAKELARKGNYHRNNESK